VKPFGARRLKKMRKIEKVLSAALTITLGILLIILKANIISILMTILGVSLIVLGIIDLINKDATVGVCKLVVGGVLILCGWVIVSAVLYIVAAILLIAGILLLYEKIKRKIKFDCLWKTVCSYASPIIFIVIGFCLLFNQGNTLNWIFVASGLLTVIEGGLLLVNAFVED
jgi:uncharacterized membrane protein HdeD (DUF308 family)